MQPSTIIKPCHSHFQSTDETQPFLSLSSETDHFEGRISVQQKAQEQASPEPPSPECGALWRRVKYKVRLEAMLRRVGKELNQPSPLLEPEAQSERIKTCKLPIFEPSNLLVRGWGAVSLALLTYTFLVVPFNFAFLDSEDYAPWMYINSLVDLLFACDIIIRLNTGFHDQSCKLVTSRRDIYERYGSAWLAVDLIATVPLHLLPTQLLNGRLSRVNRLVRILRILKLFQLFQSSRGLDMMDNFNVKLGTIRFLSFIAATLLTCHLFTCLWRLISIIEVDNPDNWLFTYHKEDLNDLELYLFILHWTIQTLSTCGFGDMVPCTSLERSVGIVWMFFAVLFVSYTVGCLGTVLDPQNSKENVLFRKQAIIDEFAAEAQLSAQLRQQLHHTIRQTVENSDSLQHEVLSTFQDLPEDLRYEVAQVIHHGALQSLRFFKERDKGFVVDVFPFLKHRSVPKGFSVYEAKQASEHVYFILTGVCTVLTQGMDVIKRLRAGSYFGDIEIFRGRARLHTVKAATDCEFLTLNRPLLSFLKKKYSEIHKKMEATAKDKEKAWAQTAVQVAELKQQYQIQRQRSMQERLADVRERRRSSVGSIHMLPIDPVQIQVSQLEARMQFVSSALKELRQVFGDIAFYVGVEAESATSLASSHWSEHDIYSGYSTPEEH